MSIFYKITSANGAISYLFGTIHISSIEFTTLPMQVKQALDQATTFIMEGDSRENDSWINLYYSIKKWVRSQQGYLAGISPNDLSIANMWLEHSSDITPYSVAQFLMSKADSHDTEPDENHLDKQLLTYAELKSKKVFFLESAEEQMSAFLGLHLNLLEKIQFYRFMESELAKCGIFFNGKDSQRAYRQQDVQALKKTLNPYSSTSNIPEPVRRYYNGIGLDRDLKMAESIQRYLKIGNAFIAVGAGHLEEIINNLQSENYEVEAVLLGKRYCPIEGTLDDGEKVAAFRQIYNALYLTQTSLFKKRVFIPNEDIIVPLKQIQDYISQNSNSRSAIAWRLAELHYKDTSSTNNELLKAICQESYARSSNFGFFKRTRTNLDDAQSIAEAASNTRTGSVRDILDGPQI